MNKTLKQLTLPGFPEPLQKELYTLPKSCPDLPKPGNPKYKQFEPLLPMFSISPDYVALYNRRASDVLMSEGQDEYQKDEAKEKHKQKLIEDLQAAKKKHREEKKGTLSRSGRSRMKQRCGYLFYHASDKVIHNTVKNYSYKLKLNVITLTLTQEQFHDDSFFKRKLYKNFIDALRKRYPGLSYVWRAETQENGNLHFHILTDHYIPIWYVNGLWLGILRRHGYKTTVEKPDPHNMGETVWVNLNPVDVEKVRNEKDLGRYIRKYMAKGLDDSTLPELRKKLQTLYKEIHFCSSATDRHTLSIDIAKIKKAVSIMERRKVIGKIWGCSDNLVLKPYRSAVDWITEEDRERLLSLKEIHSEKYTKVLGIESFTLFLNGFSQEFTDKLLEYYNAVFPKNKCPFVEFYSDSNYTYEYNAIAS